MSPAPIRLPAPWRIARESARVVRLTEAPAPRPRRWLALIGLISIIPFCFATAGGPILLILPRVLAVAAVAVLCAGEFLTRSWEAGDNFMEQRWTIGGRSWSRRYLGATLQVRRRLDGLGAERGRVYLRRRGEVVGILPELWWDDALALAELLSARTGWPIEVRRRGSGPPGSDSAGT